MYFPTTPGIFKKVFSKDLVWEINTERKAIWLTFDDGPDPAVTPRVLETLRNFNAKATFFCLGKNVEAYPGIYEMIGNAGHSTGNHSFSHKNGWTTHTKEYMDDIEKCSHFVQSSLFRPPYGKLKPSQLRLLKLQYSIIIWSLMSGDFDARLKKEKCLEILLDHTVKGSIVVFHDSLNAKETLQFVLPKFLEYFSDKGFSFLTLKEV